ncbi:hypothetical protein NDU88_003109 [Pleurodeles waltl]|uniref:Uncharacterized protein n=1 Tax=Pleurodeles waltl TaxID=8319 RepID=A0AAV7SF86_PLEWA|nr:hypothetical protein NDU88_003109 [Pleurodeles waltl]
MPGTVLGEDSAQLSRRVHTGVRTSDLREGGGSAYRIGEFWRAPPGWIPGHWLRRGCSGPRWGFRSGPPELPSVAGLCPRPAGVLSMRNRAARARSHNGASEKHNSGFLKLHMSGVVWNLHEHNKVLLKDGYCQDFNVG